MRTRLLVSTILGLMLAGPASAQLCGPTDDPCVVAASTTVDSGTIIDVGSRHFVIASGKALSVNGTGVITIIAGNVTLEDNAKIFASGTGGFGGDVRIATTGTLALGTGSRIDVQAAYGGDIDFAATTVQIDGQVKASATSRDGDGGIVTIVSLGDTTIAGSGIQAMGGDRFSSGGLVDVIADGDILVSAPIDVRGGDGDGGDIDLDALGDVVTTATGALTSISTWPLGSGGATSITAGLSVTMDGLIYGRGQGDLIDGGGDGGDLDIIADGGDVLVRGRVELDGSAPDGFGGFMDVFANGTITLHADIQLTAGREGGGGDLLLTADDVTINGNVDLQAGFIGGAVDVFASGSVTVAATIDASSNGGPYGEYGGLFDILSCDIDIQGGARLLAVGNGTSPRATIRLRATNSMTIAGTVQAGALVELRYKNSFPVFVPGFVIDPSPVLVADATLPCCVSCTTSTTVVGGTTTTIPVAVCGNGIPETGEACDDGNLLAGDCCSPTCTLDPPGTACFDDGNVCTTDVCNGGGACTHPAGNAGTLCRPATADCDADETCDGVSASCPPDGDVPNGTACDEDLCFTGQTCTDGACGGGTPVTCAACEACSPSTGCAAAPALACREPFFPGKSILLVKDKDPDSKDKLVWKWVKGQATDLVDFGDPAGSDDYVLCVFDESGPQTTVAASAAMPAGGLCGGRACWRPTSSGFKYVDKERTPDGVAKMVLKAGGDASALAIVKAKGDALPTPVLPLSPPFRAQLMGGGTCWETRFSTPGVKRNDGAILKAVSD